MTDRDQTSSAKPLSGFRVLDLTNVLAGPFCCHQLAHMGADVVKVETPGTGDLARQLGADPDLNAEKMGVSFLAQNAGKRSIAVNLKSEHGKAVLRALVREADVLVENFRPGVMKRLGLDYESLSAENPSLIYCAISGFGQDGPLHALPAYDQIIQGISGIMSVTGAPDTAPYRVGYPICDTLGGITAAFSIACALNRPKEGPTNEKRGCFLDVSMLEATIASLGWAVSNYLNAGVVPEPLGNDNVSASPSGAFGTKDGLINIAANKQEQFETLCDVIGRAELKIDPRFALRQSRLENRSALKAEIEAALALKPAKEWSSLLNQAGVPAGEVLSVPEALDLPQIQERGMIDVFEDVPGVEKPVKIARPGVKIDGASPSVDLPPPRLGAHTDQILHELGFDQTAIDTMKQEGAVA